MKTSDLRPSKPARIVAIDDASTDPSTRSWSEGVSLVKRDANATPSGATCSRYARKRPKSRRMRSSMRAVHASTNPATSTASGLGIDGSSTRSAAAMRRAACWVTTNCHPDIPTRTRPGGTS
jgi:hypothetical protein